MLQVTEKAKQIIDNYLKYQKEKPAVRIMMLRGG